MSREVLSGPGTLKTQLPLTSAANETAQSKKLPAHTATSLLRLCTSSQFIPAPDGQEIHYPEFRAVFHKLIYWIQSETHAKLVKDRSAPDYSITPRGVGLKGEVPNGESGSYRSRAVGREPDRPRSDSGAASEIELKSKCASANDLIDADIVFANGDGKQYMPLLKQIREALPSLPFVVVTRIPETSDWLDALEAGATDYCSAPFEARQIGWLMESALPRPHTVAA